MRQKSNSQVSTPNLILRQDHSPNCLKNFPSALKQPLQQKFMPADVLMNYKIEVCLPSEKQVKGQGRKLLSEKAKESQKVLFSEPEPLEKQIQIVKIDEINQDVSEEMKHIQRLYQTYKTEAQYSTQIKQIEDPKQNHKIQNKKSCCQIQ